MSMQDIIKNNMISLQKETQIIINFKDKVVFFVLNKKYTLEDLDDMNITTNKIHLKLKGEDKNFIIDKKFYITLKQLKVLIIEEKDLQEMFEKNPILIESIVKINEDVKNKTLKFEGNMSARKITSLIEKELIKNVGDKELEFNYRYREYTFDN